MAVSEDRELGTSQTQKKLWDTIELKYNDKLPRDAFKRPAKRLSARYASIAKKLKKCNKVCKYVYPSTKCATVRSERKRHG